MLEAADRLDRRAASETDKAVEVANLRRQGLTYPQIAERLSIATSTAHYRQARYEQSRDRIPRTRIWVRLLCAAGLRIDEACRVRRSDVDLIAKRLQVRQAKTDAGVRNVQLTPDTVADLERYMRLTADRPAAEALLPTRRGTRHGRTNAAKQVIRPLIAQTNVVLAEQGKSALRDGVTAHALRKRTSRFCTRPVPRHAGSQTKAATSTRRRPCASTPSRCAGANADNTASVRRPPQRTHPTAGLTPPAAEPSLMADASGSSLTRGGRR